MPPENMPPSKTKPTGIVESGESRVTTRATNANKHPGTEAKKALQVQHRRDPEVIKADKERKKEAKEAKEDARRAEAAQREIAEQNLELYRARQAASLEHDVSSPQQQSKTSKLVLSSVLQIMLFNRWKETKGCQ